MVAVYDPARVDPTAAALALYRKRQARLDDPIGTFDKQGRWYPADRERAACCDGIRQPSKRWPYSLLLHCRTLRHCQALYEVQS